MESSPAARASIGRYELVGPLAIGGMAEVLLARVRGPSGFERPVVIKRILPHLACERDFREMFLDEARIAARIRHPNVVAVEELGEDANNLFLVMEYLEGESLSTFAKLMKKLGERLPPHLGAYIIAEACAGLHAAHELKGPDGHPLGVVHRDVSPQNVFALYDGHVKVIDFGIAKAQNSESKTRTGQIKGKFSYMAPEQLMAHPLDRRSDIFSLGILLFELTTGVRLFERANDLLVFKAICEEGMPMPSQVVPGYPPVLERVCMRALQRNPHLRYESAAALRRDLLAALRELVPPERQPEEELAQLLHRIFADRISRKKQMLATLERGERVAAVPPGEDSFRSEASRAQKTAPTGLPWKPAPGPAFQWNPEPPPPGHPVMATQPMQAANIAFMPTQLIPVVGSAPPVDSSAPLSDENLPTKTNTAISNGKSSVVMLPQRKRWPFVVVAVVVVGGAAAIIPLALRNKSPPSTNAATPTATSTIASTAITPGITINTSISEVTPPAEESVTGSAVASAEPAPSSASATRPGTTPRWKPPPTGVGPKTAAPTATSTGFRRFE